MMLEISPPDGSLNCTVSLPFSKSIANRLLMIRAVSGHNFSIMNMPDANDTVLLQQHLENTGTIIEAGEGGTTFRFLLAWLALKGKDCTLTGTGRMNSRPVKPLADALGKIGATIEYINQDGKPPLRIHPASLHGGRLSIDASVSSQFISALMLIAPALDEGMELHLTGNVVSASYIRMTAALMKAYGININHKGNVIHIEPGLYINRDYSVEGDWSAAAFWLMAAAFSKECKIILKNLSNESLQGDAALIQIAPAFGVKISIDDEGCLLEKNGRHQNEIALDFSDIPDLAPSLVLLSAALEMKGTFTGLQTLRHKESDRIAAIEDLIHRLGGETETSGDQLYVLPRPLIRPKTVLPAFNDHRIAMSLAMLSLAAGPVIIDSADCVSKSYPSFWDHLEEGGFGLKKVAQL